MTIKQKAGSAKQVRNVPGYTRTRIIQTYEPNSVQETKPYADYLREKYSAVRKSKESPK